jgi:hypothetical protein
MIRCVDIAFDCLPLRSITRFDIPLDASPGFRARCERVLRAISAHGAHNTYYLYNATCRFRLTNRDDVGMLEFSFEGTVLTDPTDQKTAGCDLSVELVRETCDWLTQPVVDWFRQTVLRAVAVEFDRYIAAGDLKKAVDRAERLQAASDEKSGYLGMYL